MLAFKTFLTLHIYCGTLRGDGWGKQETFQDIFWTSSVLFLATGVTPIICCHPRNPEFGDKS